MTLVVKMLRLRPADLYRMYCLCGARFSAVYCMSGV